MSDYLYEKQRNDPTLSKNQLHRTFAVMRQWAEQMVSNNPDVYNFDIIKSIYQQFASYGRISWKQYKVMEKYWFKWYIYSSKIMKGYTMGDMDEPMDEEWIAEAGFEEGITEKTFNRLFSTKHSIKG
jgi:alpha-L-fucosidase